MAIKASTLRMGGINSGLDTEAIVNAMSAATKLKITTNQRKVLKLEAQQDAYRGIIDKVNSLKNKYFNLLNGSSCLTSSTNLNRYSSTLRQNGVEKSISGVNVSSNYNAKDANYNVKVVETASQAKATSQSINANNPFDPIDYESGKTYAMKVTVGSVEKCIAFEGDSVASNVIDNINNALKDAFGKTNSGDGLVSVKTDSGKYVFNSTDKSAITTSKISELKGSITLTPNFASGSNSLTIVIGGEEKTISFSTIDMDYFNDLFTNDPNKIDPNTGFARDADKEKINLFNQTITEMFNTERHEAYEAWKAGMGSDYTELQKTFDDFQYESSAEQFNLFLAEVDRRNEERHDTKFNETLDKLVLSAYKEFDKQQRADGKKVTDDDYVWLDEDWKNNWISETYGVSDADELKAKFTANTFGDNNAADEQFIKDFEKSFESYVGGRIELEDYDTFYKASYKEEAAYNNNIYDTDPVNIKLESYLNVYKDAYNEFDTERTAAYELWKTANSISDEKPASYDELSATRRTLFDNEVNRVNEELKQTHFDNAVAKEHAKLYGSMDVADPEYKDLDAYKTYLTGEGFTKDSFDNFSAVDTDLYNQFKSYYDDFDKAEINTSTKLQNFYKNGYDEKAAYTSQVYTGVPLSDFLDDPKYDGLIKSAEEAATLFNENAVKLNLERTEFKDGTKLEVTGDVTSGFTVKAYTLDDDGDKVYKDLDILSNSTKSDFGLEETKSTASTVNESTKLSELNLTPDSKGKYNFEINGQSFSFSGDKTIKEMMATVNANEKAGVKMTFSTLSNSFEIASLKYGTDASVTYTDGDEGLLSALGFNAISEPVTGKNMRLDINGEIVETNSNSYTIDGTTFTIASTVAEGTEFDVEVKRDTSALKDLIKSFMNDYNELIDYVYGMVKEKPKTDYYFLTDDDREELQLSEKQEEMWETAAKKGLLYNDSTVIDVMSKLRMALTGSVTGVDGKAFSLYSLGITTNSDYAQNGKLEFYNGSETYLDDALINNFENIVKLFTDTENGVFNKFAKQLDYAGKTTGARTDKGVLVQKAGLASGNSSTDNYFYEQIKNLNKVITSLESRYEKQQDRYWNIFTALEKQMGTLNGQTGYIDQLMNM